MALDARLQALAQAIATDIKTLLSNQGNLTALNTTAKGSLVAAINEIHAALSSAGGAIIDDAATTGDTDSTWSANKIIAELGNLRTGLLNGVDPAFDTLQELAAELGDQDSAINNLLAAVGNRIRYDTSQTLTTAQQLQACQNIGVGNPEIDLVAAYNAAKA